MNAPDTGSDDYRAGFLAGYTERQAEIDTLEDLADRYYRKAYGDERRIPGDTVTRAELEQRRQLLEPPVEVTRAAALAFWGLTNDATAAETDQAPKPTAGEDPPARTTRTARRRPVRSRTIIGNLAVDPEVVQAGRGSRSFGSSRTRGSTGVGSTSRTRMRRPISLRRNSNSEKARQRPSGSVTQLSSSDVNTPPA